MPAISSAGKRSWPQHVQAAFRRRCETAAPSAAPGSGLTEAGSLPRLRPSRRPWAPYPNILSFSSRFVVMPPNGRSDIIFDEDEDLGLAGASDRPFSDGGSLTEPLYEPLPSSVNCTRKTTLTRPLDV